MTLPDISIRGRVISFIRISAAGVTRREIADALGYTYTQVRTVVSYLGRSKATEERALAEKVGARPMTGQSRHYQVKLRAAASEHVQAFALVRQGWPDRLIAREMGWSAEQMAAAMRTAAGERAAALRAAAQARPLVKKWDDHHLVKFNRLRALGATDEEIAAACRKTAEQVWRRRRFIASERAGSGYGEGSGGTTREAAPADMRDWRPGVKPAARMLESDAIAALFKAVERPERRSADIIPFRRQPPPSLAHGRTGEAAS